MSIIDNMVGDLHVYGYSVQKALKIMTYFFKP